ncbi:MAG TPA: TIGR04141 family sporadically distributed protein [Firmicutes bacterium]|nr:TIGR04141 family sporadically distributed protein [Bacillota bacterium]
MHLRLNVFLIKEDFRDFEALMEEDVKFTAFPLKKALGVEGMLFMGSNRSNVPRWLPLLQEAVDAKIEEIFNASTRAVLLIQRKGRIFAFPFGQGRHMLVKEAVVQDFGIRIAMNSAETDRLSSIDTVRVGDITVRQRTQTSRKSPINAFDLDFNSSILNVLTAKPRNEEYGVKITGRQSVQFSKQVEFFDLPALCDELYSLYISDDYKKDFAWYDHIQYITDPVLLEKLNQELFNTLQQGAAEDFHLAPPEIIDHGRVESFSFTKGGNRDADLLAEEYLTYFNERKRDLGSLDRHRVYAWEDEIPIYSWKLFDCIVFEAKIDNDVYVLTGGSWFKVDQDFSSKVDSYVEAIPNFGIELPACNSGEYEKDYNKRVAHELDFLCLDHQLVRYRGGSIEVCDLLTPSNQLIHVKHWRSSSTLSHLFSQGKNSAEILLQDEEFLKAVLKKIHQHGKDFLRLRDGRFVSSDFEIVYAVIYQEERPMHERLPFFSRLNMMNAAQSLKNLGFNVSKIRVGKG